MTNDCYIIVLPCHFIGLENSIQRNPCEVMLNGFTTRREKNYEKLMNIRIIHLWIIYTSAIWAWRVCKLQNCTELSYFHTERIFKWRINRRWKEMTLNMCVYHTVAAEKRNYIRNLQLKKGKMRNKKKLWCRTGCERSLIQTSRTLHYSSLLWTEVFWRERSSWRVLVYVSIIILNKNIINIK